MLFEELNLSNNLNFKRMDKFYCCNTCKSSHINIEDIIISPLLKMVNIKGYNIYYPIENDDNNSMEDNEINATDLVMIPKNLLFKSNEKVDMFPINIYKCKIVNNSYLSTLYNNHVYRYYQRKTYVERYEATVLPSREKTIGNIKPIMDDSMIRSSDTWISSKLSGINSRFENFGDIAIGFEFEIPINNKESIATAVIIQGAVVTIEFIGNENYDLQTKYMLHNHNVEKNCDDTCVKKELTDPNFDAVLPLSSRYLSIFIATISQKIKAVVKYLILNKNCSIHSKEYYIGVEFLINGNAKVIGILWTEQCTKINENLSTSSLTGEFNDHEDYLQYIEKVIMTSAHTMEIQERLGNSNLNAENFSQIVDKYQLIDFKDKLEDLQLPSIFTSFIYTPEETFSQNLFQSKILRSILKKYLYNVSNHDKEILTTIDWLRSLNSNFYIERTNDNVKITIDEETYIILIDERLSNLLNDNEEFIAIYQYLITCQSKQNSVVLKRKYVKECFIKPYNSDLLRAINQSVNIYTINGFQEWESIQEDLIEVTLNIENCELNKLQKTHKIVTVAELFALTDVMKVKQIQSSTIEFVSSYIVKKQKFKKTIARNENTYKSENDERPYSQLSSNIKRHNSRLNGEHLLLCETALWYDLMLKNDSTGINVIYRDNLEKIPIREAFKLTVSQ